MSTETTDALDLDAVRAQIARAHTLIGELSSGTTRWRMSVPVDVDRDSDMILSAALTAADALLAEVQRLTAERDGLAETLDQVNRTGVAGRMHPVDKAFYDLTVRERDFERVRGNRLTVERDQARAEVQRLREVCAAVAELRDRWHRQPGHTEEADALDAVLDDVEATP
jgi:hypothetical protein